MFAKLIFISTMLTFVHVQSVECCEPQTSFLLDTNARPTKTVSTFCSFIDILFESSNDKVCFTDGTKAGARIQTAGKLADESRDCYFAAALRYSTRKSGTHASRYETSESEGDKLQTRPTNRFTTRLLRIERWIHDTCSSN